MSSGVGVRRNVHGKTYTHRFVQVPALLQVAMACLRTVSVSPHSFTCVGVSVGFYASASDGKAREPFVYQRTFRMRRHPALLPRLEVRETIAWSTFIQCTVACALPAIAYSTPVLRGHRNLPAPGVLTGGQKKN